MPHLASFYVVEDDTEFFIFQPSLFKITISFCHIQATALRVLATIARAHVRHTILTVNSRGESQTWDLNESVTVVGLQGSLCPAAFLCVWIWRRLGVQGKGRQAITSMRISLSVFSKTPKIMSCAFRILRYLSKYVTLELTSITSLISKILWDLFCCLLFFFWWQHQERLR